jgi:hypothetical protein
MKIGLLTASHKRPNIDKCWCLMADRLRNDYPDLFTPVAVVSLPEDKKVFEEHSVETYLYENQPLGTKHNYLFSKAKGRFTHVLYAGSDDIVNKNYVDEVLKNEDKDIVWGVGIWFYSVSLKQARFWDAPYHHAAGPVKLISSKLLDQVNWVAYKREQFNNLDHKSWDIMNPFIKSQYSFNVKDIGGLQMDIKSEVNYNPYSRFINNGIGVDLNDIYNKLPEIESDYLKSIN